MAQGKPQVKFERNLYVKFRDTCDTDGRRTKTPYHDLCWQSQAELIKCWAQYCPQWFVTLSTCIYTSWHIKDRWENCRHTNFHTTSRRFTNGTSYSKPVPIDAGIGPSQLKCLSHEMTPKYFVVQIPLLKEKWRIDLHIHVPCLFSILRLASNQIIHVYNYGTVCV